jgi:hypothetical protein
LSVLAEALDISRSISPMDAEARARAIGEMAAEPIIFPIPA